MTQHTSRQQAQFDYINKTYNVQAKRGLRVVAYGKPGIITAADGPYLYIQLDGQKRSNPYHPTDGIEYDAKPEGAHAP